MTEKESTINVQIYPTYYFNKHLISLGNASLAAFGGKEGEKLITPLVR